MVEGIAYPGVAKTIGRQADVILAPDAFVFEDIHPAQAGSQVPCQRIDAPTFLYILNDDCQISPGL